MLQLWQNQFVNSVFRYSLESREDWVLRTRRRKRAILEIFSVMAWRNRRNYPRLQAHLPFKFDFHDKTRWLTQKIERHGTFPEANWNGFRQPIFSFRRLNLNLLDFETRGSLSLFQMDRKWMFIFFYSKRWYFICE